MRPTRFYSTKQEKQVAKAINGKRSANSGASLWQKSDVTNDLFAIECKTHTEFKENFTVKHSWIDKNREEAFQMGKRYSAIVLDWGDHENHYLISESLFLQLLDYLRECNKND